MNLVTMMFVLSMGASAFASNLCDQKVTDVYRNEVEGKGFRFGSVVRIDQKTAEQRIFMSEELDPQEKSQALEKIQGISALLYQSFYAFPDGRAWQVLVVSPETCERQSQILFLYEYE